MGSKAGSASNVKLSSFDDLFGGAENTAGEQIINVKLADLHTFKGHPFRVLDDEKMKKQRRASVNTVCLCRGLQDQGQEAAMRS